MNLFRFHWREAIVCAVAVGMLCGLYLALR